MKKGGHIGSILEVEDVLDFPYTNFKEACLSILEGGLKILQASKGALLLIESDEGTRELEFQAVYPSEESFAEREALKSMALLLLEEEEELYGKGRGLKGPELEGISSYLCIPLKRVAREQRLSNSERRQFAFEELTRLVGVFYLERDASQKPFSSQDLNMLRSYLMYSTTHLFHAKIYEQAALDSLTHFFTRSQLEPLIQAEIKLAQKFSSPLSLLMVDLKGFKNVNHNWGDEVGNRVLKEFAAITLKNIRKEDSGVRYGGDKFLFLLPCTGEQGAKILARKLQREVSNHGFYGGQVSLKTTMGIVVYPIHGSSPEKLIKRADEALSTAKETKKKLAIWTTEIDPSHHSDRLLGIITGDSSKDYRNVMMLLDTIVAVNSTLDYKHLLSIIVDMMIEMTHSDRCFLLTYDREGVLQETLGQDKDGHEISPENYLEEIVGRVHETGMPYTEKDITIEDAPVITRMEELNIETFMCVPLTVRDKVIGVVYVDSASHNKEFSHQDKIFFYALSREIGIAMENARLYEENLQAKEKVEELNKKLQEKVKMQASELEEVKGTLNANLKELNRKYTYKNIVGHSKALQDIFSILDRVTESDVPVLINGESGTGKELVSKAIHYNGPRKARRFLSINCAALSDSLLESELFGYVKGAFTGADQDRKGLFELAHNGTLFLDEVGDMSLKMQKELLRVLQEGEIRPVGAKEIIKVNVRLICATNRDLKKMMETGEYREDLYYRINVVQLRLPPLRERKEDILPLAEKFLHDFAKDQSISPKKMTPEAVSLLMKYDWPGNIRELKNVMERTSLICPAEVITPQDIILDMDRVTPSSSGYNHLFEFAYQEAKDEFIRQYLQAILEKANGNVTRAAKRAGVLRSSFHKMIKKYNA